MPTTTTSTAASAAPLPPSLPHHINVASLLKKIDPTQSLLVPAYTKIDGQKTEATLEHYTFMTPNKGERH